MKLKEKLFPKNKTYDELEEPIKTLLMTKTFLAFCAFLLALAVNIFAQFPWQVDVFVDVTLLFYIGTVFHTWWLFITDSVCSLEGTYTGRPKMDENDRAHNKKLKHKVFERRIYLVKDEQKFEVVVKSYDEDLEKGDVIKLYTVPSNVFQKSNGVIHISSVLCLFTTKSKIQIDVDKETE